MDNRTRNMLAFEAVDLVERALQAGRDDMAKVLADWLAESRKAQADDDGTTSEASQHYLEGIEDALITLVQAGATDPRDTGGEQS